MIVKPVVNAPIRRNTSSPEGRAIWENVERTASLLRAGDTSSSVERSPITEDKKDKG